MTHEAYGEPLPSLDPEFTFEFRPCDELDVSTQRWSTWWVVDPLCRGPEPRPDWVDISRGAIDTELGILKTGKEADVFLLERSDPHLGTSVVMAAKRYRDTDHRSFHRAATYTEGRSVKRSRDERALKRKSNWGREVAKYEWATSEWNALVRLWRLGAPVPYPVQIDGTEVLMEWVRDTEGESAPRLAQTRPSPVLLRAYFDQLVDALALMAQEGIVHGDLSAYNILATGERLVIIDLPQIVDLVGNPQGFDFLHRDVANVCGWFGARGLDVDPEETYAHLVAHAF